MFVEIFYGDNTFRIEDVKKEIKASVTDEADQWVGCAMTYTLFEWVKENKQQLIANQPDSIQNHFKELHVEEKQQVNTEKIIFCRSESFLCIKIIAQLLLHNHGECWMAIWSNR